VAQTATRQGLAAPRIGSSGTPGRIMGPDGVEAARMVADGLREEVKEDGQLNSAAGPHSRHTTATHKAIRHQGLWAHP
jgi:hypothetical protein